MLGAISLFFFFGFIIVPALILLIPERYKKLESEDKTKFIIFYSLGYFSPVLLSWILFMYQFAKSFNIGAF